MLLAFREEENLKMLLPQIREHVAQCGEEFEILVIDTAKPTDNTRAVCKQLGATYINQEEPAFAGAFRTGIRYAAMDKFLILDSDGSHPPEKIPEIYRMFVNERKDVVIGSRYCKGGTTDDAKSSQLMSAVLNTAFRVCLGLRAKDLSTDYRMYHTAQLKKVHLKCRNYDVLEEVLLKLQMEKGKKLNIGEVPISFSRRVFGESKRRLLPFILSYMKTLVTLTGMRIFRRK
ncbi:MAG: glycosyltransferase [Oscillospiraceae bacterium]